MAGYITPSFADWLKRFMPIHPSLRLEFFDRLDNLCDLSGEKMTDELEGEVVRLFGEDMLRVIENYAEYDPNRLSTQQKDGFIRVFPRQFELQARYLFTLSCDPTGPALELLFDDIVNVPAGITDPNDIAQWYAIGFDGINLTDIVVDGNTVKFYGDTGGEFKMDPFVDNTHLLQISDQAGLVETVTTLVIPNLTGLLACEFPALLSIGDFGFYNSSTLFAFTAPLLETIGGSAFFGCNPLGSFTFDCPAVITIGDNAFEAAGTFIANFPACTTVGARSFYQSVVTEAYFDVCTSMGTFCFLDAQGLNVADFPILVDIPEGAFWNTSILTTYDFPLAETAGDNAFNSSGIPDIDFPELITCGYRSFQSCANATSVSLPNLEDIGIESITVCNQITSITLPALLIGDADCISTNTALTTVSLPNCVSLDNGAVQLCPSLTSFSGPLIETTGSIIFLGCTSLVTVDLTSCTDLGGTPGDDGVFDGITGNIMTIDIDVSQQTIDGGNPDGDLVAVLAVNPGSTINYI